MLFPKATANHSVTVEEFIVSWNSTLASERNLRSYRAVNIVETIDLTVNLHRMVRRSGAGFADRNLRFDFCVDSSCPRCTAILIRKLAGCRRNRGFLAVRDGAVGTRCTIRPRNPVEGQCTARRINPKGIRSLSHYSISGFPVPKVWFPLARSSRPASRSVRQWFSSR